MKQIAQGYGFKYLHLGQPAWVQSIWNAGFTPLRPPSFYNSPEGYLVVFPPGFQLVSAWLYEKWGTAGLYVIPMLSTVVLMYWFVALMKRSGVRPMMVALGLFVLVFCLLAVPNVHAQTKKITAAEAKDHVGDRMTVCGKVASTHYAKS